MRGGCLDNERADVRSRVMTSTYARALRARCRCWRRGRQHRLRWARAGWPTAYARQISAGEALIIVVGSGAMAVSDTITVWVVDDTEHQVLDEFVSIREAVEQQIEEIVALCAYEPRWTMDVIRINGSPLRLVGVAVQKS